MYEIDYMSGLGETGDYVRAGSRIHWNAAVQYNWFNALGNSINNYIHPFINRASQSGFANVRAQITGTITPHLVVDCNTTVDFARRDDARSLLSGIAYAVGFRLAGANDLYVVQQGTGYNPNLPASPHAPPPDTTEWNEVLSQLSAMVGGSGNLTIAVAMILLGYLIISRR